MSAPSGRAGDTVQGCRTIRFSEKFVAFVAGFFNQFSLLQTESEQPHRYRIRSDPINPFTPLWSGSHPGAYRLCRWILTEPLGQRQVDLSCTSAAASEQHLPELLALG